MKIWSANRHISFSSSRHLPLPEGTLLKWPTKDLEKLSCPEQRHRGMPPPPTFPGARQGRRSLEVCKGGREGIETCDGENAGEI